MCFPSRDNCLVSAWNKIVQNTDWLPCQASCDCKWFFKTSKTKLQELLTSLDYYYKPKKFEHSLWHMLLKIWTSKEMHCLFVVQYLILVKTGLVCKKIESKTFNHTVTRKSLVKASIRQLMTKFISIGWKWRNMCTNKIFSKRVFLQVDERHSLERFCWELGATLF